MLNNLEKGDIVAIKDTTGATHQVTVLSVRPDYDHPGSFVRFDYINYNEASPMRRTAYPKELMQILKKTTSRPLDPKAPRPGDARAAAPGRIQLNGKVYMEVPTGTEGEVPLNPEGNKQVHPAVTSPQKPVTSRITKGKTSAAAQ